MFRCIFHSAFLKSALPSLCLVSIGLISACAPVTHEPNITNAEREKEIAVQESISEAWVLENEKAVQAKLHAGHKPKQRITRHKYAFTDRTYDIWHRLQTANAPLCYKNTKPSIGALGMTRSRWSDKQPWTKPLKLSRNHPTLAFVANNSPAQDAGLEIGDKIIAVDGLRIQNADFLSGKTPGNPVVLDLIRNETFFQKTVTPQRACRYEIYTSNSQQVNAFADGDNVTIYRGIMNFAKNDDEIAFILGHEMAHNIMLHNQKSRVNTTVAILLGSLIDGTINTAFRVGPFGPKSRIGRFAAYHMDNKLSSQQFETEADYVGVYLTARAQYDVSHVGEFWRRMSIQSSDRIDSYWGTHPNYTDRYLVIKKTAEEIQAKIKAKQPILPTVSYTNPLQDKDAKPKDIMPEMVTVPRIIEFQ